VKLFIDEDLSPSLASEAHAAGYDATCVRDRGKLGTKDPNLASFLFDEDRVLVTNNAGDFLDLAEARGLHPGLIFMGLGSAGEEREWLKSAIGHIERISKAAKQPPAAFMTNHVLTVSDDGSCENYPWP
jgi:predicted nuclease of predicted toxin-antitoxin system